jgi:hypothetical protein
MLYYIMVNAMGLPGFTAERSLYSSIYRHGIGATDSFDNIEKILPQMRKWVGPGYEYDFCYCRDWEDDEEMVSGSSCYCW